VSAETGLWAYCVTRTGADLQGAPPGVDGSHAVEAIAAGDLAVHVSEVPLREYGTAALRENLNDFAWLERVAFAHEAVLEHALARATIVPLRLCTIFTDADGAREMLAERDAELRASLQALEGREEWSVKVLADPRALVAAAAAERGAEPAAAGAGGSGAAYLMARRTEREDRAAAERIAAAIADDVHARVQDHADAAVVRPPQNRELSGHEGDMLLNGAYLIPAGSAAALHALADDLAARHRDLGVRVQLSGPFPPYNFAAGTPS
jgi:hypothetical protein